MGFIQNHIYGKHFEWKNTLEHKDTGLYCGLFFLPSIGYQFSSKLKVKLMRIRLSASWKSNHLNNDIQIDHLVSCKCWVRVIFQNNTFVQLAQVSRHTVSSCGGQTPSLLLSVGPWTEGPRLSLEHPVPCVWVCASGWVWGGEESAQERDPPPLKMTLLISSVWEKEKVVKMKKKQKQFEIQPYVFKPPSALFVSPPKSCRLVSYLMKYYRPAWNESGL